MAKNLAIAIGVNYYDYLQPLNYAKRDAMLIRCSFSLMIPLILRLNQPVPTVVICCESCASGLKLNRNLDLAE
ncbi:hypothetical protein [Anabaena sp. CCY 9402-a]|uniref:hypothetical protein n=1 Tax=Anabaena sp. CCY 9402-a TaxID=3103867 RepID=UPI0039C6224D